MAAGLSEDGCTAARFRMLQYLECERPRCHDSWHQYDPPRRDGSRCCIPLQPTGRKCRAEGSFRRYGNGVGPHIDSSLLFCACCRLSRLVTSRLMISQRLNTQPAKAGDNPSNSVRVVTVRIKEVAYGYLNRDCSHRIFICGFARSMGATLCHLTRPGFDRRNGRGGKSPPANRKKCLSSCDRRQQGRGGGL